MGVEEAKLTRQRQITIPKRVCDALHLQGGDRLEILLTADGCLSLKPKKLIDADDPAYRLGLEVLEAERQIKRGEVIAWDKVKRQHGL